MTFLVPFRGRKFNLRSDWRWVAKLDSQERNTHFKATGLV